MRVLYFYRRNRLSAFVCCWYSHEIPIIRTGIFLITCWIHIISGWNRMTVLTLIFHNPSASPNKQKKKNGFFYAAPECGQAVGFCVTSINLFMISATQRIQPDCGYHKQVFNITFAFEYVFIPPFKAFLLCLPVININFSGYNDLICCMSCQVCM